MLKRKLSFVLLAGGRSTRMGKDKTFLKIKEHNGLDFFENALSVLIDLAYANNVSNREVDDSSKHIKYSIDVSFVVSCREEQKTLMGERVQKFLRIKNDGMPNLQLSFFGGDNLPQPPMSSFFCKQNLQNHENSDFRIIPDKGIGVCEAISTCIEEMQSDCLFIPCDVPFIHARLLQKLIDAWILYNKSIVMCAPLCVEKGVNKTNYATIQNDYTVLHKNHSIGEGQQDLQEEGVNKNKELNKSVFEKPRKESLIAIYRVESLPYLLECVQNNKPLQKALPASELEVVLCSCEESVFFQNMNRVEDLKPYL